MSVEAINHRRVCIAMAAARAEREVCGHLQIAADGFCSRHCRQPLHLYCCGES